MIPLDKLLHFLSGFVIASFVAIFVPFYWGVLGAGLAGVGKEQYSKWRYGSVWDWYDVLCTTLGGVLFYVFEIFKLINQ